MTIDNNFIFIEAAGHRRYEYICKILQFSKTEPREREKICELTNEQGKLK